MDPKHKIGKPDSEGGLGYVNQVNVKHYNVEHSSVSHRLSPDVSPRRLNPALFETN